MVTGRADLYQHATATAVIEPVGRLLQRSHAPPQGTGQHPGRQGIKGLPNRLPKALRTEGPGSDGQSNVPGLRLIDHLPSSIAKEPTARHEPARAAAVQQYDPELLPPQTAADRVSVWEVLEKEADPDRAAPQITRSHHQPTHVHRSQRRAIAKFPRVSTAINTLLLQTSRHAEFAIVDGLRRTMGAASHHLPSQKRCALVQEASPTAWISALLR